MRPACRGGRLSYRLARSAAILSCVAIKSPSTSCSSSPDCSALRTRYRNPVRRGQGSADPCDASLAPSPGSLPETSSDVPGPVGRTNSFRCTLGGRHRTLFFGCLPLRQTGKAPGGLRPAVRRVRATGASRRTPCVGMPPGSRPPASRFDRCSEKCPTPILSRIRRFPSQTDLRNAGLIGPARVVKEAMLSFLELATE